VRFFVTAARDLLCAQNKGNEHKLGDWGFIVDSSPQAAAKVAKAAAKNKPAA
jgi:hypothetical protein